MVDPSTINSTPSTATTTVNSTTNSNSTLPTGSGRRLQAVDSTNGTTNSSNAINATNIVNGTSASNGTAVSNSTMNSTADNSTAANSTNANSTTPNNGTIIDNGNNSTSSNTTSDNSTATNNTMPPPLIAPAPISGNSIYCCDFYEKGAGYEFSVCDGLGAIIRSELIGSQKDKQWALMTPDMIDITPVWNDLSVLVDNYCDKRTQYMADISNQTNSTNMTIQSAWSQINLPWGDWKADALNSFDNIGTWLGRYQQYLGMAANYANDQSINVDQILNVVEQQIAGVDSNLNFTSVSYGELVNDYNAVYTQFLGWYNTFFGPQGLVTANMTTVQDGQTTLIETQVGVPSMNINDVFAVEEPLFAAVPPQISMIADWINLKFAPAIISSVKSSICGVPVVESNSTNMTSPANMTNATNATNGTNSTGVVGNSTNATNGTNSTNSTMETPYNATNYQVPENCTLLTDEETVSCSTGNSSTFNFTFAEINSFFNNDISTLAGNLNTIDGACNSVDSCLATQASGLFSSKMLTSAYVWLFFDSAARSAVFTQFQNVDSAFKVPESDFTAMFTDAANL